MAAVQSFHFDIDAKLSISSEGASLDVPIDLKGDFQAPDRTRGTLVVSFLIFQVESQFVSIGDTSYATDPETGQWTVEQDSALDFVDPAAIASPELLAEAAGLADLILVGTGALGGVQVHELAGRLSDEAGAGELDVTYWIGVDDGLIHQVDLKGQFELDEELGGIIPVGDIEVSEATIEAVLTLSDFGKPVQIEAPEVAAPPASGTAARDVPESIMATPLDSGWVRYKAMGDEFALSLPPEWEIVQLNLDDVPASLESLGAENRVLAGRVTRQIEILPEAGEVKLFGFDRGGPPADEGLTSVSVVGQDAGVVLSLDFYAALGMQLVLALPGLDGQVERNRVSLFGTAAEELRYTLNLPDPVYRDARLSVIQYLFAKGTVLWALTLATPADTAEENLTVLEDIAQSIEVPALAGGPTQGASKQPAQETTMAKSYDSPPAMAIDATKSYRATFTMEGGGEFVVELYAAEAPVTVNNFVFLARDGFYDGVTFHRVIPGFMAQGGDPTGTGSGGPGYRFGDEFHADRRHDRPGILSMANAGPGTNGSQFFITFVPTPHLDGAHTVFGAVIEGMDVVNAIAVRDPSTTTSPGDAIRSIAIEEG